jgi:hypothetical protein
MFIKEDNNQALHEIAHIKNIAISIRVIVIIIIGLACSTIIIDNISLSNLLNNSVKYNQINFY